MQEESLAVAETRAAVAWPEEKKVVWGMDPGPLPAREYPLLSFGDQLVSLLTAEPLWGLRQYCLSRFLMTPEARPEEGSTSGPRQLRWEHELDSGLVWF